MTVEEIIRSTPGIAVDEPEVVGSATYDDSELDPEFDPDLDPADTSIPHAEERKMRRWQLGLRRNGKPGFAQKPQSARGRKRRIIARRLRRPPTFTFTETYSPKVSSFMEAWAWNLVGDEKPHIVIQWMLDPSMEYHPYSFEDGVNITLKMFQRAESILKDASTGDWKLWARNAPRPTPEELATALQRIDISIKKTPWVLIYGNMRVTRIDAVVDCMLENRKLVPWTSVPSNLNMTLHEGGSFTIDLPTNPVMPLVLEPQTMTPPQENNNVG